MAKPRTRRFRLRLRELMKEQGFSQARLVRETGLSPRRAGVLCKDAWAKLSREEMEWLCEVFHVSPSELFFEPDLFEGARASGEVTLHLNCRWTRGGRGSQTRRAEALSFNAWDTEAGLLVYRHLTGRGIRVHFQTHRPEESPPDSGIDELFPRGSHVVIGSQLTSFLTEQAVAAMHGAQPFDQSERHRFPMHIAWTSSRRETSAFGCTASPETGKPLGIYSGEGSQLASREDVPHGFGRDCGLIVLYRSGEPPRSRREGNGNGTGAVERSIIVLAGHGGPGTFGCATTLIDPDNADELYPPDAGQPIMRAVQVQFRRIPSEVAPGIDDREFHSAELVAAPELSPQRRPPDVALARSKKKRK